MVEFLRARELFGQHRLERAADGRDSAPTARSGTDDVELRPQANDGLLPNGRVKRMFRHCAYASNAQPLWESFARRLAVACVLGGGDSGIGLAHNTPAARQQLSGHTGCVNTVEWGRLSNAYHGDALVSGSDDTTVCVWRGSTPDESIGRGEFQPRRSREHAEREVLGGEISKYSNADGSAFHMSLAAQVITGHSRNIFSAKFVPQSDCQRVVSCGMDGEVRLSYVDSSVSPVLLGSFDQFLFKIYFLPLAPTVFLTTHQDGSVRLFDLRQSNRDRRGGGSEPVTDSDTRTLLYRLSGDPTERQSQRRGAFMGPQDGPTNTLSFAADGLRMAVGGGDPFVRVLDLRVSGQHDSVTVDSSGEFADSLSSERLLGRICPLPVLEAYRDRDRRSFQRSFVTSVDWNSSWSSSAECTFPGASRLHGGGDLLINYSGDDVFLVDAEQSLQKHAEFAARVRSNLDSPAEPDNDPSSSELYNAVGNTFSRRYTGRRNVQTFLKEAAFICGGRYVATGSDCGHMFVWDRATAEVVQMIKADDSIVNAVAPHPTQPIVAVSGIDHSIKIIAPCSRKRRLRLDDDVSDEDVYSRRAKSVLTHNEDMTERHRNGEEESDEEGGITVAQLFALLSRMRRAQAAEEGRANAEDSDEDSEDGTGQQVELSDDQRLARRIRQASRMRNHANQTFRQGEYQTAVSLYSEIIDDVLDTTDFDNASEETLRQVERSRLLALQNRAACFVRLEQWQSCLDDCNEAIESGEEVDFAKVRYRRGLAYMHLGLLTEAREDLTFASTVYADDAAIQRALSELSGLESASEASSVLS